MIYYHDPQEGIVLILDDQGLVKGQWFYSKIVKILRKERWHTYLHVGNTFMGFTYLCNNTEEPSALLKDIL